MMTVFRAYLETGEDGRCLAHILELPGCALRTLGREEALQRLPAAIRGYQSWMQLHGELASCGDEPVRIEIAEESTGFGPFDPGDAAALFSPDREPITPEGMEIYFRLMTYSRSDLLGLVMPLPWEILDREPAPEAFSINRLLRHVGNAEEWYVSRIVPPERLPPEWDQDEKLPIFEFLEMERRTAVARLSNLTEAERTDIFYPRHWTNHPDEPWTTRKVLRRFLEHEREHTTQIQEILGKYPAG